jgi:hypothetical protein
LRAILHVLAMLAVALGVGFGLSYYSLTDGRFFGVYRDGPWSAWPDAGTNAPDPYTSAYLSRSGTLQLGRSEGIRFVAETDSDGRPLRPDCRYRIDGQMPLAAFWTLAATAPDGTLIASGSGAKAINSARIAREADGSAVIHVGRSLSPGNWYEISPEGRFWLVLTLYDTTLFSGLGPAFSGLPSIAAEGCA